MLAAVQAFILRPMVEAKTPRPIDDLDQDEGSDKRVGGRYQSSSQLNLDLRPPAVFQCSQLIRASRPRLPESDRGEAAGQNRAEKSSHSVHAKRIERIVILEEWFQRDGCITDCAGN